MNTPAPPRAPGRADVLPQARSENFPVASHLFPSHVRPHLMRVYGYARLVDDIGDEVPGDRLAALDWLSGELSTLYAGGTPSHPLMADLAETVRTFHIPREPFDRLIEANRRDQSVHRHPTFRDLLAYCSLSADPVGEVVLFVLRAWTPRRVALSNATCTGLQLVEFWQDLGEDGAKGRIYVPMEDLARFGYGPQELLAGVRDDRFLRLMRFEAGRTRELLARGRPLAATLPGRMGLAVRLFTAGGLAALDDLERRAFDTFDRSARPSRLRRTWAMARELAR